MRKSLISALVAAFLLTSCSVDWNSEKDKKIEELQKQVTELKNAASTGAVVFEKRTKCAALGPDVEKKMSELDKKYEKIGKSSVGGIFYSPEKDACLWIWLTDSYAADGTPVQRRSLYQYGEDYGATEPLVECEKPLGENRGTDACEKWNGKLKELKGETVVEKPFPQS